LTHEDIRIGCIFINSNIMTMKKHFIPVLALFTACLVSLQAKPLKVYILCGQSNMQGHADEKTLEHVGMDPKTAPILKEILDCDGKAKEFDNIWISSVDGSTETGEKFGKLTIGYGAGGRGVKIGPELTFGIYMQKHVGEPILIIKTSWGGKSINTDFRSPSAGPYEFNEQQIENFKKQGKDLAEMKKERADKTGHYYRLMLEHVNKVLQDIKRVYPGYNPKDGYELSGFVWFQGWNDMVDGGTYPNRGEPGSYDAYSQALAHFIRDVRKDLKAPSLPFVIGVMGAGGPIDQYPPQKMRYAGIHGEFRKAMAAPASLKEFEGNVKAVWTEKYWDNQLSELQDRKGKLNAKNKELSQNKTLSREDRQKQLDAYQKELFTAEELKILDVGISNAEFHYLGSAKILGQIGKAFADAVNELSK
jgi:hypothetical protein